MQYLQFLQQPLETSMRNIFLNSANEDSITEFVGMDEIFLTQRFLTFLGALPSG